MTPVEAARELVSAKFTGWQVVVMGAIGAAESGLDELAVNINDDDPTSPAYLSVDWGVWQINDYWWRHLLDSQLPASMQLLDRHVNARAARSVFVQSGGLKDAPTGFSAWIVYQKKAHLPFMVAARSAARLVGVAEV
jgi:hypothetical protein